jgi:hypothetical protein
MDVDNRHGPIPETRVPRIFRAVPYHQGVRNRAEFGDCAQHRALARRLQTETANASERIQSDLAASGGRAGDDEGVSVWVEF